MVPVAAGSVGSSSTTAVVNKILTRRLYRNLLRASKPFTAPSPIAPVLGCLLHRTGIDDHIQDWNNFIEQPYRGSIGTSVGGSDADDADDGNGYVIRRTPDEARNLAISYVPSHSNHRSASAFKTDPTKSHRTYQRLFRRLLREVVGGSEHGHAKMVFPSQVDTEQLQRVIRREFRAKSASTNGQDETSIDDPLAVSSYFDDSTRLRVAMVSLRELHKKLSYFDNLSENAPTPVTNQAASHVSALPMSPPSSFLRPGCFLVSHPLLNDGFFNKSVICILKHQPLNSDNKQDDEGDRSYTTMIDSEDDVSVASTSSTSPHDEARGAYTEPGQTYGVIINRVSINHETGRQRTLREAFQDHMLPARLAEVFGNAVVREGGPVHVALQMIYSLSSSTDPVDLSMSSPASAEAIGGTLIPEITDEVHESAALYSDRATFFRGNMFKAMDAVNDGSLDRDDISFFVGASTWSQGQLAAEIAQGFWRPMRGPPEIALHGICEHEQSMIKSIESSEGEKSGHIKRPLADLWLSMMSACGPDDSALAHLFHHETWDELQLPCDAFAEEDDDDDDDDDGDDSRSIIMF